MKIFVTGTRGIPDIPGGVEKHCQELFPRIAALGHHVLLCTRKPYLKKRIDAWRGVNLTAGLALRQKSLEAISHTFIALIKARFWNPDVVHIHAVGPSLLTPFARMMGLKVVVTNHGPEYNRKKWGRVAKVVLKFAEKIGATYANEVIAISSGAQNIISERYRRESTLISNGVTIPAHSEKSEFLRKIGVMPFKYILAVARFVPEKGLHDLINAFKSLEGNYKLVIAGDTDHESTYSRNLRKSAGEDNRIVLTGYITRGPLNQVYTHARLFVLPSYYEGLPIALLEALSYGLPVLVSDISANKEVGLSKNYYFSCGNISDLKKKMRILLDEGITEDEREKIFIQIENKYNWDDIAKKTIEVYEKAINGKKTI
jgi:glycosyltransferase involved in cell wall biosynthesis